MTNENHESRVVMSTAVANNHEVSVAKQETASSSPIVSDPDPEHSLKPVISESAAPLNLNVRPEHIQQELYTYQRNGLEDDRENANTNTLFVWIETSPNQIVPDA